MGIKDIIAKYVGRTPAESEAQEAKQEIITNEEIESLLDVAQPEADVVEVPKVEDHTEVTAEPVVEKELPTEGELVINAPVDLAIPYEAIESLSFDEVRSIFYIKLVGAVSTQSIKVRGSIGRQAYRYVRSEGYKVAII